MTGLISHQQFLEILAKEITTIREDGGTGALLLVELEHLRSIRERLGIAGSDLITRDLAKVTHKLIQSVHTLGRFADHTFTLYLPKDDIAAATTLAEQVRIAIETHICDVAGQSVSASCSIGIVEINSMTVDAQSALTHADIACRSAIHSGGNAVRVYEPAVFEQAIVEQLTVGSAQLRAALSDGSVELRFQPMINLRGDHYEVFRSRPRCMMSPITSLVTTRF